MPTLLNLGVALLTLASHLFLKSLRHSVRHYQLSSAGIIATASDQELLLFRWLLIEERLETDVIIVACRSMKVCHSREELWALPPGPKVVLASVLSLAAGAALQLLVDWGPNPNNLILFPAQAPVSPSSSRLVAKRTRNGKWKDL